MIARSSLLLLASLAIFFVIVEAQKTNDRPIIGIVTQPTRKYEYPWLPGKTSRIAGEYVKYVEMTGARAVPVQYDLPEEKLRQVFNSVNGLLFQGGPTDIIDHHNPYYEVSKKLYQWSMEANDKGDFFPIWGTCLGFELFMIIGSNDGFDVLGNFDAENYAIPLDFTPEAATSRLFGNMPAELLDIMKTRNVTSNWHHNGVTPQVFFSRPSLPAAWKILSLNKDRKGVEFISTVEAIKYPFYSTQWHPERPLFCWDPNEENARDPIGVPAMQYFANFFVDEARKSGHRFQSQEEERALLMQNFDKVWMVKFDPKNLDENYYFDSPNPVPAPVPVIPVV